MNKLEFIYNHFGQENQFDKLREEVEEFIEAVRSGNLDHMEEEFADVQLILAQHKKVYHLDADRVIDHEKYKCSRTIARIKDGYYEGRK